MNLIWAESEDDKELICTLVGDSIAHLGGTDFGPCVAGAVVGKDHKLKAGIILHNYQPDWRTIEVSAAAFARRWAHPDILRQITEYAFVQLRVYKLYAHVRLQSDALSFMMHCGFKREATLRHFYGPGLHAVVVSMIHPEWKKSRWDVKHQPRQQRQTP